jgi:multidrug efflux pump
LANRRRGAALSRFFIDRPIFASVLSIVITLAGGVAVFTLPIAQLPPFVPPTIQVNCSYPGASAQVVAESIAAPIEQYVNGVEEMLYMSSNCTNDGSYTLGVTFKPGVNMNFAQVLVQNKVNLALPSLPDVVKQSGVTTRKRSPDILMVVTLTSPNGRYDQLYLSNYAAIHIKDELARLEGIGDVIAFGAKDYSMRIWVDPERLAGMNLNASDVVNAVRNQNAQVAAGQIGQAPAAKDQPWQITLETRGRLTEPEEFAEIVIKRTAEGRIVRIKDIGHVELGARNEDVKNALNLGDGPRPCANIALFQLPDANALDTADRIRAKMDELGKDFPEGVKYHIRFDTTPFIRESIHEVVRTLFAAVVLVAIVVLVFLQSWRSALIPLVAVPVAIVGTFAVMAAVGFSLNNLTLFGLVLAIGIVVDDAIVVVEAVEHHIEQGMSPRDATIQAMREVSGPVIAVALVLTAVFMPCTFISGITGSFFKQFAVTVSVSTVISAFNSLTLSPALAAILLKPIHAKKDPVGRFLDFTLGWFFKLFNWTFKHATNGYLGVVGVLLRGSAIVLVLYGGLLAATTWGILQVPPGYLPDQDKGYLLVSLQLPDAAAVERTRQVVEKIDRIIHEEPAVASTVTLAGQSFTLGVISPNAGQFFIILKDYDERKDDASYYSAIKQRLEARIAAEVPEAQARLFGPPALQGLGNASGFKIMVEDRGEMDLTNLQKQTDALLAAARQLKNEATGELVFDKPFTSFTVKYPQLFVDVNRDQVHTMGLNLSEVYNTLQTYLGSFYVNDFNLFGRTWQVVVQADAKFRNNIEAVRRLKVRNAAGNMAPLGSVADIREVNGPLVVPRYNLYPSAAVQGGWPPGESSGEAIAAFQKLAAERLPKSMTTEWTEISYLQLIAENTGMIIFGLAVLLVFLVLAAQYESWSLPLAIILVVPMCLLSATAGVWLWHVFGGQPLEINIFTQIGFVVLVGLASKNAVLIVEFAKHKYEETGVSIREAALEACRLRLRPILMTSFAFILGVVPLVMARGAGMEMRKALGIAVFSGMIGVTVFGIFLTPVFFFVIEWLGTTRLFSSRGMHRVGSVLLLILMVVVFPPIALLWAWRRYRRPMTASTPAEVLERELADIDRFLSPRQPRQPRDQHSLREVAPLAGGESVLVVDHPYGKTDIIVVQQTTAPAPAEVQVDTDQAEAKPLIADLVEPQSSRGGPSPPERREETKST